MKLSRSPIFTFAYIQQNKIETNNVNIYLLLYSFHKNKIK